MLHRLKRFFHRVKLWLDFNKRRKFKAALKRYEPLIIEWEKTHDENPPIVWFPPDKDYIWVTRDMRKGFQSKIRKQLKRGE